MTGSTQSYERNTAILITVMTAADGSAVRVTDFAPRFMQYDRIFRPPMILRRIEPIAGTPRRPGDDAAHHGLWPA